MTNEPTRIVKEWLERAAAEMGADDQEVPPQVAIDQMRGRVLVSEAVLPGSRPVSRVKNKRVELWAHLVSEHAGIWPLDATYDELKDEHDHEHKGPGTIRNHPEESRAYSVKKLGQVLSESEE